MQKNAFLCNNIELALLKAKFYFNLFYLTYDITILIDRVQKVIFYLIRDGQIIGDEKGILIISVIDKMRTGRRTIFLRLVAIPSGERTL